MDVIKKRDSIEIMSPVRSFESLEAAITAGADAVFFGIGELNMRATDKVSFSPDDLPKIVEICQGHGVKSYLALNIIIYDDEIDRMRSLVDKAKESNISAIIACDHSVLLYCEKVGMPLHISTQANISNIKEVEYYSRFADTMVLGRELTLDQIGYIASEIERKGIKGPSGQLVRIEIFVHGYFCMGIAGKCYLSLHTYNSPLNRGQCRIPCSRKYIVTDAKNGTEYFVDNEYIMSAKNLCTIDFVDKIIEAGVSVFKIEGRTRDTSYIHTTTKCYREAVDAYFAGTYSQEKINNWIIELSSVYNRGFWSGYYLGKKIETEDRSGDPASQTIKEKTLIAKGVRYLEEEKRAEFKLEGRVLREGDDLLIVGPKVGVITRETEDIRVAGRKVDVIRAGEVFSIPSREVICKQTKMYKVTYHDPQAVHTLAGIAAKKILGEKGYNRLRQLMSGKND